MAFDRMYTSFQNYRPISVKGLFYGNNKFLRDYQKKGYRSIKIFNYKLSISIMGDIKVTFNSTIALKFYIFQIMFPVKN